MRTTDRRAVLGAGLAVAGGGLLAACSGSPDGTDTGGGPSAGTAADYVAPDGKEVAAAERRRDPGPARKVRLTAVESRLDLGGRTVRSWSYGERLPGEEIRVTAGDTLDVTLSNHLPEPTSVHWHGLALRNDMDGVPGLTQRPVRAGGDFRGRFAVAHPGTYWFHPHSGVQQDRGLYAPLIVEDPKEPLAYDHEWVVVLDDWLDGVDGSTPEAVLTELSAGMPGMSGMTARSGEGEGEGEGHGGHDGKSGSGGRRDGEGDAGHGGKGGGPSRMAQGARSALLGGDAGDVAHPLHLVNGRTSDAPRTFRAKPGDRIRLRIVNAGGDTAYRVARNGHAF